MCGQPGNRGNVLTQTNTQTPSHPSQTMSTTQTQVVADVVSSAPATDVSVTDAPATKVKKPRKTKVTVAPVVDVQKEDGEDEEMCKVVKPKKVSSKGKTGAKKATKDEEEVVVPTKTSKKNVVAEEVVAPKKKGSKKNAAAEVEEVVAPKKKGSKKKKSSDEEENDEDAAPKKKKRKMKKTDENGLPLKKKPLTGYMNFVKQERPNVVAQYPELKFTEIGAHMGKMWKALTPEKQLTYKTVPVTDPVTTDATTMPSKPSASVVSVASEAPAVATV